MLNTIKDSLSKLITQKIELFGAILGYISFILNDLEKIKKMNILQYVLENWNWLIISILFGGFIYYLRLSIKDDILKANKDLVKSNEDLKHLFLPQLAMTNILIKEVLIPNISEKDFYKLLEYNVFENKKFNIQDLENFGIDKKHINKLRTKYHELELKNFKNK